MFPNFVSMIDGGNPNFSHDDSGTYAIINGSDLDKGRWVHDFLEPLNYGDQYKIKGRVSTTAPLARVSLVWIANMPGEQVHSVEHAAEQGPGDPQDFEFIFPVPSGVKALRIELRGRAGSGLYEFQNIELVQLQDEPDPDPEPGPDPEPDMSKTLSIIIGKTRWRITASEQSITFLKLDHEPLLQANNIHYWID